MTARVLAAAFAGCCAFWALMVAAFGWWAVVTVTAIAAALIAYIAVARSLRPPLPQRHPGAALKAHDEALDQFAQAIDDYETCRAIWNSPQHTHPHRKEN